MKHHKILISVFLLLLIVSFLLSPFILTVSASDSQNEQAERLEKALKISVFYEYKEEHLIKSMDVNEAGSYAIGCEDNTILIFDAHDVFQYGVRFEPTGTYGIAELKDNSIVIYLTRSHVLFEVDSTGKCINLEEIPFSNNFSDDVLYRAFKKIGNTEYYLERDIGLFKGNYSRFVRMDVTGNKTILYDVTVRGYVVGVLHYVLISMFPIVGVIIFIQKLREDPTKQKDSTGDGSAC